VSSSRPSVTKKDFDECDWQSVIGGSENKEYHAYSGYFAAKAREAEIAGEIETQKVFALLRDVCSLMLQAEEPEEPFGIAIQIQGRRSASLDDFSEENLNVLREIAPEVLDPEMRARIADILWVKKRDFLMGRLAVDAYLEAASVLEHPEEWSEGAHRVERAMRVAMALREGKNPVYLSKVITHIEGILDKYNGEDPSFLSNKMMELLQDLLRKKLWEGDPTKYIAFAEKAAFRAEAEHNWWKAEHYWKTKARWHELVNDGEQKRLALVAAAETHVKAAEDALRSPDPSYLAASFHLEEAIKCFKLIAGMQKRVEELYMKLLEYQEESLAEMKTVHVEIPLRPEEVEALSQATDLAREAVKGKTIQEALLTLACMGFSPSVDHLKEVAQKVVKDTPLQHLISAEIKNEVGRIVGRRSSMLEEDPIKKEMFQHARLAQQFQALYIIEPVRQQINSEHGSQPQDLLPIVTNNPFVPQRREYIYMKGLYAGLTGDFLVAAHLLIPQLENSIRHLLYRSGTATSKFDEYEIQDEFDLNTMLGKYHPQLVGILGEDTVFDLQGLLVERSGYNLRNLTAHGLLNYEGFSLQVSYLWWLVLRLCFSEICEQDILNKPSDKKG
jgi:hypothetical protein